MSWLFDNIVHLTTNFVSLVGKHANISQQGLGMNVTMTIKAKLKLRHVYSSDVKIKPEDISFKNEKLKPKNNLYSTPSQKKAKSLSSNIEKLSAFDHKSCLQEDIYMNNSITFP